MLKLVTGNIFDIDANVLINTVNCVGVMGCGVALAFKNRYPNMFIEYKTRCNRHQIVPGVLWTYQTKDGKTVVNFPTKDHWRNPSKYSYIDKGLKELRTLLLECIDGSIVAIPALGCGHGGLDWDTIWEMIQEQLGDLDRVTIHVFQPQDSRRMR